MCVLYTIRQGKKSNLLSNSDIKRVTVKVCLSERNEEWMKKGKVEVGLVRGC